MHRSATRSPFAPVTKDLVLVGGGHSHVAVLKHFGAKPLAGVRLTLISRESNAPYSGMLPGLVAGHYTFSDAHIDLAPLSRFAGARFLRDQVVGVDLENKRVLCADRPPVAFDVLSLNTGSAPGMGKVAGAEESAVPVKPIDGFYARWQELRTRVTASAEPVKIGIVGGGAGGVELALSLRHGLERAAREAGHAPAIRIELFTRSREVLPTYPSRMRRAFARTLARDGVVVHTGRHVVAVEGRKLRYRTPPSPADTPVLSAAFDEILWVTTAAAPDWPRKSGLDVDARGFIRVHTTLQSLAHPDVFATGDIAAVEGFPRPKAGVFAVRQGPPLARNLERHLQARPLVSFRPQQEYLSLISTGRRYAIGARNGLVAGGRWVWIWKDRIDRQFIRMYSDLPLLNGKETRASGEPAPGSGAVPKSGSGAATERSGAGRHGAPELHPSSMRCGGCGSKVGSELLHRALSRLNAEPRSDILVGLDAPDDAAVTRIPSGRLAVQSVDFFRAFIDDPFLFGRIAANHALGDIHAMGAEPSTAMVLVTLPLASEEKMEEELVQLMAGALRVLSREGVALVGGHTSEGSELAMGFSVTGMAAPHELMRKSGLRPGDRIVLTRPLGTGLLFAAEMRGKAQSLWIDDALAVMQESHGPAARILREHGAVAATDVTGFGLVGHLLEMARASGADISIDLDRIPLLEGALQVAEAGIFSSLQSQNLRALAAVRGKARVLDDLRTQILVDPQTAGGLVAGVPAERAEAARTALRAAGCPQAALIGSVAPVTEAGDTGVALHLRAGPGG